MPTDLHGQVLVKIDGTKVENVTRVELGVNVGKATDGHPTDARPRVKMISITRKSDKKSDWWKWAAKPWLEAAKNGEIQFFDPKKENTVIKTVKWEKGWVSSYVENVPHIQYQRDSPMTETIHIAVQVFDIDGHKIKTYED